MRGQAETVWDGRNIARCNTDDIQPGGFVSAMAPRALQDGQSPSAKLIERTRLRNTSTGPQRGRRGMLQNATKAAHLVNSKNGKLTFTRCRGNERAQTAPRTARRMGDHRHAACKGQCVAVEIKRIDTGHGLVNRITTNEESGNVNHDRTPQQPFHRHEQHGARRARSAPPIGQQGAQSGGNAECGDHRSRCGRCRCGRRPRRSCHQLQFGIGAGNRDA